MICLTSAPSTKEPLLAQLLRYPSKTEFIVCIFVLVFSLLGTKVRNRLFFERLRLSLGNY